MIISPSRFIYVSWLGLGVSQGLNGEDFFPLFFFKPPKESGQDSQPTIWQIAACVIRYSWKRTCRGGGVGGGDVVNAERSRTFIIQQVNGADVQKRKAGYLSAYLD